MILAGILQSLLINSISALCIFADIRTFK